MKLYVTISLFGAFAFLTAGCADNGESIEAKSIEQVHRENGIPVRTERVKARDIEAEYSFYEVLTGIEETTASAMIADKVEKINYRVGDRVEKDAIVATFPTDNPAAQYYQAKVAYEHAETTLKRIKNLYDNGGISLQEYDNTRTQYDVAKANWETVKQSVAVKAPISGTLTNLAVRESDNVKPGDILFTIAKTNKLKTRIWASEHQIPDIRVGNRAAASWRGITIEGRVTQADLSLDTSKQAFGVVIEFDNPQDRMMCGVNAEVIIEGKKTEGVVMTARKNILNDGDTRYVFLAGDGKAVRRDVTTGRSLGLNIEILAGLNPGDELITEGMTLLEYNTKISVNN